MKYSDAEDILLKVESTIDVNSITYDNYVIWPILKYYLFFGLCGIGNDNNTGDIKRSSIRKYSPDVIQKIANHTNQLFKIIFYSYKSFIEINKIKKLTATSILFIDVSDAEYVDTVNEKKYSRYISPYFEFIKKKYSTLFFNLSELKSKHVKLNEPYNFNVKYFLSKYRLLYYYFNRFKPQKEVIDNFNLIEKNKSINYISTIISGDELVKVMNEIICYEKIWSIILKQTTPKVVFIECFYGNLKYYGLIAACKKMDIKVVDIQHGYANIMYLGWDKKMKTGSTYLPDFYWCWSKYDVENLKKSRRESNYLQPILGGNLWMKKHLNDQVINAYSKKVKCIVNKGNYKKKIIVTLQHSLSISDILIKALTNSPTDWIWLIRFHPLDFVDKEYRSKYIKVLLNFSNVEFENSTNADLYYLFKITDIHITHYSTSCLEALSFGLQTILIGKENEHFYKDLIKKEIFFLADTYNNILELIESSCKLKEMDYDFFKIETSEDASIKALKMLLN